MLLTPTQKKTHTYVGILYSNKIILCGACYIYLGTWEKSGAKFVRARGLFIIHRAPARCVMPCVNRVDMTVELWNKALVCKALTSPFQVLRILIQPKSPDKWVIET